MLVRKASNRFIANIDAVGTEKQRKAAKRTATPVAEEEGKNYVKLEPRILVLQMALRLFYLSQSLDLLQET